MEKIFEEITVGSVFYYDNEYYIKTATYYDDEGNDIFNAMSISSYCFVWFADDKIVKFIKKHTDVQLALTL